MSAILNLQDFIVILLAVAAFLYVRKVKRSTDYPLPPSPKGWLPILGHALRIPTSDGWRTFERWRAELGSDLIYLDAAGSHLLVVNSYEIAKDLLDSRSAIYSGRPSFVMVNELMGYDWTMPTLPYGPKWKDQRRTFSKFFSASNPSAYQPRIAEFVHLLLPKLLEEPGDFIAHIKHMVGATVTSLAYGINIQAVDDPNLKLAQDSLDSVLEALFPGRYWVDSIPLLKHLPAWLPGTGFLDDGKRGRETMTRLLELPFAEAEKQIAEGTAQPALVSMVLDDVRELKDPKEIELTIRQCKELAAVFFGAGFDTTHATITNFVLAMVCNPEAQARARAEIDREVGSDRLPQFSDQENLPYLRAVLKEVLRWRPVSAIGMPHLSTEDDIYSGYFIPQNTLIIVNQRGILFDPDAYPQPDEFKPERFLSPDGKTHNLTIRDPHTIVFGFGRRMCPGFHIATDELFLAAASILATFELRKAKDEEGNVIEPSLEVTPGVALFHPLPFECVIKPRNAKAQELILSAAVPYDV